MELRTERLFLRPFLAQDGSAFASFVSDASYRRYLGASHPTSEQFLANNLSVDWERELSWVITLDGDVIGSIFLGIHSEDGNAELACLLAPSVWGQGIALEAGRAVVNYAFNSLGIQEVLARADRENAASIRAMTKGGMVQRASSRDVATQLNESRNEVVYRVTREEWRRSRRPDGPTD